MGAARLSVVVAADRYPTISRLVDRLCAQTVASDLELVVACPFRSGLDVPIAARRSLAAVGVVEAPLLPLGQARAAAVRATTGPIVAIGETHAFPAPDWGEHVLRAHEGSCAVVVPAIANGNPDGGPQSWSSFLIDYGEWTSERPAGDVAAPPPYNVAYTRDVLLELDARLAELLEPGSVLAQELARRGRRSCFVPESRIEHLNLARTGPWLHERFLGGRLLGAKRRARWSFLRTFVYVGGSPLIPVIRLLRTWPALVEARRSGRLPRWTTLAVVLACVVWGVGELVGYVAGRGRAESLMLEYELHKARYS